MDLEAYFERVGHHGPRNCSVETLQALTRAHTEAIPFETIDVLLRRPIDLASGQLFEKLVRQGRGGYCFEQNGLFMAVLESLGFRVRPLRAGVRLDQPDRGIAVGHTHLVLAVEVDGRRWLTDVGVGSTSLTAALQWVDGIVQPTPHDERRLQREGGRWFHQIRRAGEWLDIYDFSELPMPLPDQLIASWYTSTHPASSFQRELIVARALPDGGRASLRGRELVRRSASGHALARTLNDAEALEHALREVFGLVLPAQDVALLLA